MSCPNPDCTHPSGWPVIDETGNFTCQYCGTPRLADQSRAALQKWISTERKAWADTKYADKAKHDVNMANAGIEWWMIFLTNYLSRAKLFGLDTPSGRQALGKMITTAMDCLESAIRVHGPMPRPGVTSGEIHADIPTSS